MGTPSHYGARELVVEIERSTIERGRTFSARALDEASREIAHWLARETIARWDQTGVPPTRAVITVDLQ